MVATLSDEEAEAVLHDWGLWARDNQLLPPGDWSTWLILAGRGYGKTRTGAETVRQWAVSGTYGRIALVAETAADARDVMVEGESGILAISPKWERPKYEPSKRRLTWPNGAVATTYSAEEPDQLRGPQHDAAWCDELAKWRYVDAWDQLMFGLRLGAWPRCVATTTPRPVKIVRDLLADPLTHITRGSTYENRANLAKSFLQKIVAKYEGTRLGRQELNAEVLDDVPGALWMRANLDAHRLPAMTPAKLEDFLRSLVRIVVAIDPAATAGEEADETGMVVVGKGRDGRGYVLEDCTLKASPDGWARRAVEAYDRWHADRIIGEVNNGGDMIEVIVRSAAEAMKREGRRPTADVPYRAVRASRGKVTRAEPIAALYEQGRFSHLGAFPALEDQMCAFTPDFDKAKAGYSPDRVDALVWAGTELFVGDLEPGAVAPAAIDRINPWAVQ